MKKILLILGFSGLFGFLSAQESTDYGLFLGMSQEHLQTILPFPKAGTLAPAVGGFYRYNFNPRHSIRAGFSTGLSSASVLNSLDLHALVEFNFLPLNPTLEKPKVSTFVAAGAGVYHLSPVLAFDVGVKYRLNERMGLSLEWDLRKKLTGLQVDAETFLWPSNWYSHIGVTASYNILKKCKTCPFYESDGKKKR